MTINAFPIADVSLPSASIPFSSIYTDGEARTFGDKLKDILCILDFIPAAQHAAIRAHTSTYEADADFASAVAALNTSGGSIYMPYGKYFFAQEISLKKRLHLFGDGDGMDGSALTELRFAPNTHGILVHRHDTNWVNNAMAIVASGGTADGSIIEKLRLRGDLAGTTGHGIWMKARAVIRDVRIDRFDGNGIYIYASATNNDPDVHGNANCWLVENVRITNCGGNGMHVSGNDGNAGVAIMVDCSGNTGWGFFDDSALGNLYVSPHSENNTLGPYKTDSAGSSQTTFLAPYSETGQNDSEFHRNTLVVGGQSGAGFNGLLNPVALPSGPLVIQDQCIFGGYAAPFTGAVGTVTTFMHDGVSIIKVKRGANPEWALMWRNTRNSLEFTYNETDTAIVWTTSDTSAAGSTIRDESNTHVGAGRMAFPKAPLIPSISDSGEYRDLKHDRGGLAAASFNTAGDVTLTAANIYTGTVVVDCAGAGRTYTLPTAALLVAGKRNVATVGDVIDCLIINGSDAAETITLAEGSGGGWDANQTAASRVIPQNSSKLIRIRLTNVTASSEAYVVYA